MWYNAATGEYVEKNQAFTHEGRSYPARWLDAADSEELARLGFVLVRTVGTYRDERFYDNVTTLENGVRTIVSTPKDRSITEASKWEAIKAHRDAILQSDITVNGKMFHTDSYSRIQFLALKSTAQDVIAAGGTRDTELQIRDRTIMWKTVTDEFVPMTAGLALDIVKTISEREYDVFIAAETHKAAMEASDDPGSYDFSAGW